MRVLFLSNFYPPSHLGGMALHCQEVVLELLKRGHQCSVLTSNARPVIRSGPQITEECEIERALHLEADIYHYRPLDYMLKHRTYERRNLSWLRSSVLFFKPDVIFVWGMWNLSAALPAAAEAIVPGRVVYSFGDYWPIEEDSHQRYWLANDGGALGRTLRSVVARLALSRLYRKRPNPQFEHAITCSKAVLGQLRQGGLSLPRAQVVLSGIDTIAFAPAGRGPNDHDDAIRIVYAGSIIPAKGVRTLIEAIGLLPEHLHDRATVTVVGHPHPDHLQDLRDLVEALGLGSRVQFRPAIPRAEMPALLRSFDVMVVPTLSKEPLGRVIMEGMACGLAVVASRTGGIPELIEHDRDGLLFETGNSQELATLLAELIEAPSLTSRLSVQARRTATARFDINRMHDEIEDYLLSVVGGSPRSAHVGPVMPSADLVR